MSLGYLFLQSLPKVLLHDHLDGGLRPETIVDLAQAQGYADLPTTDPTALADWFHRGAQRGSLPLYLEGFAHTCGVMQTAAALESAGCSAASSRCGPPPVATGSRGARRSLDPRAERHPLRANRCRARARRRRCRRGADGRAVRRCARARAARRRNAHGRSGSPSGRTARRARRSWSDVTRPRPRPALTAPGRGP